MPTVMSDTFAFASLPVPLRRRVNVRGLKIAVVLCVLVAAVGSFARWTIRSEQASFLAAAHHTAAPSIGLDQGVDPASSDLSRPASGVVAVSAADAQAQGVARTTVSRAQHLLRAGGSPAGAGPAQLARGSNGITFTDGPSIGPNIVSVTGTSTAWGAAVMSEDGMCFGVRLDVHGAARYGTLPSACSGAAALHVTGASW
jgi:hypothetical protein